MQAFIFDIDDTLYDRMSPFQLALHETFGMRIKHLEPQMRSVFHAFIRHGNACFEDGMSGRISMNTMYITRITCALKDFGLFITEDEALLFQHTYQEEQSRISTGPELAGLLADCSVMPVFLGVITNGPSVHQRDKYHALKLDQWIPEDYVLVSGDIGINKPDLRIFQEASSRWKTDDAHTFYIGDSYDHDIVSAHAFGWKTIWLDKTNRAETLPGSVADITVSSEKELADCIRSLINCNR